MSLKARLTGRIQGLKRRISYEKEKLRWTEHQRVEGCCPWALQLVRGGRAG